MRENRRQKSKSASSSFVYFLFFPAFLCSVSLSFLFPQSSHLLQLFSFPCPFHTLFQDVLPAPFTLCHSVALAWGEAAWWSACHQDQPSLRGRATGCIESHWCHHCLELCWFKAVLAKKKETLMINLHPFPFLRLSGMNLPQDFLYTLKCLS